MDLRVAYNSKEGRLYFVHGVYCDEIAFPMEDVLHFLSSHPREFVIMDLQHFYEFNESHHQQLTNYLLKQFGSIIYERSLHEYDFSELTLAKALALHKQVIVIYRNHRVDNAFFQSYFFANPWPQTTSVQKLEEFLDERLQLRSPFQGYCSQLVLTPTTSFILPRFYSSLKNKCAKKVESQCKQFLELQKPGPFNKNESPNSNVFLADFVDLNDNDFIKTVIDLNVKLLK